jgi:DNA polymerase-1
MDGYEADDVLGSVARHWVGKGLGVKIFTGDRDLLQLVDDRIIVNLPGKSLADASDYGVRDVIEKMGVRPDQVVDLKALMGDSSDNIPGIKGIGQKTAEKLLNEYETLDGVFEHVDEQSKGLQTKLVEGRDDAYLSQKLALIVTDLNVELDLEQARITNFQPGELQELFRELEFRSLTDRLTKVMEILGIIEPAVDASEQMSMFGDAQGTPEQGPAGLDIEWEIVDSADSLAAMVKELEKAKVIAFDTETTSTDQTSADLVGISLSVKPGKGYYVPVGHKKGEQLPLESVIEALQPPMTDPGIPKAGHNLKYDYVMLLRYGLDVTPLRFDTMIAEWLRDPSSRNLGLKKLAWVRLGVDMIEIEALIGKGKKQVTMAEVEIAKVAPYAAADAEVVVRMIPMLQEDLKSVKGVDLFETLEMPLIKVLAHMELAGISLDAGFLDKMSGELDVRMGELSEEIYKKVGMEFNLNSTQQLASALFDTLKIAPPEGTRKTASGTYSTAADVLDALAEENEVVQWVLEHRELAKLKSTYVDALPLQVNPVTKRVHTSYQQTGSVTGRLASTDPNLQNIPIRTELGRKVRHAFVAAPGHQLLAVDYSQVELRIVAHMSGDKNMIQAFKDDQDIHATTAAAVYEVALDQVTSDMRRHAKAINFGLIYGMSAFGLTRTTDLTLAESQNFVEAYWAQFPSVKGFLDGLQEGALKDEYVETLLGRRRYFHGLSTQSNQLVRSRQLRESINAPVQGTAADIMKLAMLRVPEALSNAKMGTKVLLQVHDELVLESPDDELQAAAALVKQEMSAAYTLKVPLKTDARGGVNWGKMTDIGD